MAEKASPAQGHILIPWADSTLLTAPIRSGRASSAAPGHVLCPHIKNKSISLYPDSRGKHQLRITSAVRPGGAAPPRTSQGFSIGVVQGFSMPRMGWWETRQSCPRPRGVGNSVVNPVGKAGTLSHINQELHT